MIPQTTSMSDEQIESTVLALIEGVGENSERNFQIACQTFNSVFFRDFPEAFRVRACRALNEHFTGHTNNFWVKSAQNEFF